MCVSNSALTDRSGTSTFAASDMLRTDACFWTCECAAPGTKPHLNEVIIFPEKLSFTDMLTAPSGVDVSDLFDVLIVSVIFLWCI